MHRRRAGGRERSLDPRVCSRDGNPGRVVFPWKITLVTHCVLLLSDLFSPLPTSTKRMHLARRKHPQGSKSKAEIFTARHYHFPLPTQFEMIPHFSTIFAYRFLKFDCWCSERFIYVPHPPTTEGRDLLDNLTETGSLINKRTSQRLPQQRDKENNTCSSHLFSPPSFLHLRTTGPLFTKFPLTQLSSSPSFFIKLVVLPQTICSEITC